jgi:anti-sigma factor (TIGR02949 family)
MSVDEMACKELVEVITDYLEGKMSPADRKRFEAHLEECPGCVNYLNQMRALTGALRQVSVEDIPPDSQSLLLALFRGWKNS